jgi:hypothetical protein
MYNSNKSKVLNNTKNKTKNKTETVKTESSTKIQ